jgi:hypothetical protein
MIDGLKDKVILFSSIVFLCRSLMTEGGIERLMFIVHSAPNEYSEKAVRFASQVISHGGVVAMILPVQLIQYAQIYIMYSVNI